ncbi:undecaprenyldiphospho-muramoylpentapeptide beta-N-acetylglucosaminyltransferase [Acetobacter sp. DsW_063]|uniref:undecaprenyldiphospho-muramoylpentapeptide beta-N-acetylglucosaminyltransferase n=1 Tax=Acetobacter sp. DsW_063 TaxID=1514894 RepID=UPI000A3A5C48|nr:undecaprenyldiphospho-muramoylpentapeptide beta-N-acetylglucosaminyltransferase [Acetobacter sp. DsW_063]
MSMRDENGPIVIAAGGTGGHFFPAEALADALVARGRRVVLMTDARAGQRTTGVFADAEQFVLPGAGVAGRGPIRALRGGLALLKGAWAARGVMTALRPSAVVGFGGYPSVPPLLGARLLGRTNRPAIILHEGNAVLGRANSVLARFADAVATSFPSVAGLPSRATAHMTGMPVRPAIAALAGEAYRAPDETIRVLVWGGSLGARVFSDVAPSALAALPLSLRARLHVTQQARTEDAERVRAAYAAAGIPARVESFFSDVPALLRDAHLVIGRAGGSSVAEIATAGRPSILVPLPVAASDEQTANARSLETIGAARLMPQPVFTVESLAAALLPLLENPNTLTAQAAAAATLARPDAAERLADLVEASLHQAPPSAYAHPHSSGPDGSGAQTPPLGSPVSVTLSGDASRSPALSMESHV